MNIWPAYSLLYPEFLWALLLLSVPVLIHLISFRKYHNVQFSDISLMQEIEKEGVARKKLRDWLVLILRCLSVVFLVLAFCVPFLGEDQKNGSGRKSWMLLDDSRSMEGLVNDLERFPLVKKLAIEVIAQSSGQNEYVVVGTNYSKYDDTPLSKENAISAIQSLSIETGIDQINDVFYLIKKEAREDTTILHDIYWFSDFEMSQDSISKLPSNVFIHLIPVESGLAQNIYIDSIWFEQPVRKRFGDENLRVRIVNNGNAIDQYEVKYEVNDVPMSHLFDLPSQNKIELTLDYQIPDKQEVYGTVSLRDNSCLFDNKVFFSYQRQNKYEVLSISESEEFNVLINKILGKDSTVNFSFVKPDRIDWSGLKKYEVIILGELERVDATLVQELARLQQESGMKLIVVCNPKGEKENYSYLMDKMGFGPIQSLDTASEEVQKVASSNLYFKDVFENMEDGQNKKVLMPRVYSHFNVTKSSSNYDVLLWTTDRDPIMLLKDGVQVLLFGITEKYSDWTKNPLIVPVVYKAVFEQVLKNRICYDLGEDQIFYFPEHNQKFVNMIGPDLEPFKVVLHGERADEMLIGGFFSKNGFYQYITDQDSGKIAVNFSTKESVHYPGKMELLKAWAGANQNVNIYDLKEENSNNEVVQEMLKQSKYYWKEALIVSFIFLFLEMVVIRLLANRFLKE